MQNLYLVSQDNIAIFPNGQGLRLDVVHNGRYKVCSAEPETENSLSSSSPAIMCSAKEDEKSNIAASIVTMRTAGLTLEQMSAVMMANNNVKCGLSARTLRRVCEQHGISSRGNVTDGDLESHVSQAVQMVIMLHYDVNHIHVVFN